ncbi:hypothetical protein KC19_3G013900 [Ceratodon purpureus]|uniref:BTB/POZ domain-containing protein n=1 Tax=Ceratodon purpureus TaxID=3225 RepID=A0A8T0IG18_CERPU|nr:hypothetical protein KC19_3G013900 [Ceratodon purpureus]
MAKAREGSVAGGFGGWLQRVRRSGEHSDVTVEVDGRELHLHLLPLLNASAYFRNLTADPNWSCTSSAACPDDGGDVPRRVVSLSGLPGGAEGLEGAVDYCYLIKPSYTVQNIARIRAAAEYLGMADMMDSTKKFLYTNVFAHWRASVAYLQHEHARLNAPVDEYIETRCLKVIVAALARAFGETKYLSAPMLTPGHVVGKREELLQSSAPCEALAEILVRVASLPDMYAGEALDALVEADVNLSVNCRQGRSVRSWLASLVDDECMSSNIRARCWVVLCLARMVARGAPKCRPWLELSSQYWCSLLEHVERLVNVPVTDDDVDQLDMQMRLVDVKRILERRIGGSLDELDEDLHSYELEPDTLLTMVGYYLEQGPLDEKSESVAEIAGEVDKFLWTYAETGSIRVDTFVSLCTAFPRQSHDSMFRAIEKLLTTRPDIATSQADKQRLWRLVDPARLSPAVHERALNNPGFLSQPHVLETVLQQHSEELAKVPDAVDSAPSMRPIMQKVINASLKLLEENSRRSQEIAELQHQYSALQLLGEKMLRSCENSAASTPCWESSLTITHRSSSLMHETQTETETEGSELDSETPSVATVSSIADQPRLDLRDIYSLETFRKPHLKSVD